MIYDVAIIGAGIGGASLAAALPKGLSVVLLEAEDRPGYHSTGRSAAFYTETYGGPQVQPLTTASKDWFFNTAHAATDALMVQKRGALHVNWSQPEGKLDRFYKGLKGLSPNLQKLDPKTCVDQCDILAERGINGGVYDPDCCDIDVANVHDHFLRQAKSKDVASKCSFRVCALLRKGGVWSVTATTGAVIRAKTLVNAAGAWADEIGIMAGACPIGLAPKRRTIAVFELSERNVSPKWPLVLDLNETFYFKPEGKYILVSPADETPTGPCDAQPEIEDVALAAHRFERSTGLKLGRCVSKWAGLRTFAPDRSPVYGFDTQVPEFFWCAGQGGFGIQTAPAAGALCAALIEHRALPSSIQTCGIGADSYAPTRFRAAA